MKARLIQMTNACRAHCAVRLRGLWWAPSPRLRPAPETLELPLQPSPRLRKARALLLSSIFLYGLELLLTGHWLALAATVGVAAVGFGPWCRLPRSGRPEPRHLVLAASGRLILTYPGDREEDVCLSARSLRLGSHLLLVLEGAGRTHRLLLGPDNLAPAELAALRRRLPAGPVAAAATALNSVAAPDSNPAHEP